MANTTLTASIVAKEALVILENELGILKRMYRAHESEFSNKVNGYKVGDTVTIRRPADFTVRSGATLSTQDVIEGSTTLVIDQQCGVDFQFTSTELTLKIEDLSTRVIKPAMSSIVNYMTNDLLTNMYRGFYNWVGTPGNTVDSFSDFAKAPERMDLMAVPQDNRAAAFSPTDYWGLVGSQTALYTSAIASDAFRRGEMGMVGGVDTLMSQVVPTHTVGPLGGTPLINGGSQSVTYDSVKTTWAQSLITDGWTAVAANRLKQGDVFTIDNVFMVNPKTKGTTGVLQQFVVNADTDSTAGGAATISISPPIIISGPHQTVNAAPADNAAITVLGSASTAYRQNLVFHQNAMGLAVVPLEMPQAAYNGARESYKGISVRVIPIYDGTNDISKWRLDLLYGRKLLDPRLGTRMSGT